jgi:glycosyltransferase involved in cell wall biosynthesis
MLKDTLVSLIDIDKSGICFETVVVDNNSTDSTHAIVEEFRSNSTLNIKHLFEPSPGLSFARNRGIRKSSGRIIAFIDDDVYLDRNWLKEIWRVFTDHPDIHCAGGNSIPIFDTAKPDWLDDSLLNIYGSTRSGDFGKYMQYPEHPFGLNMAFRRQAFDRAGLFNVRLGRIKKSLLSNEEKELFFRISQIGLKTFYTPKAILYHRVPKERLEMQWILRRYFGQGLSKVAFEQLVNKKSRLELLSDAIAHLLLVLFGTKPYKLQKTFFYFKRHPIDMKLKKVMSLGIAKQSIAEIF